MSNKPKTVTDIPTAGPFTAAISGLGKSMKCATNFLEKNLRYKIDGKKGRLIWILSLQLRKESQKNL